MADPNYEDVRKQHVEQHPERYADAYDLAQVPHWRGRVSQQHLYHLMNMTDDSPHPQGQAELPGMESVQSARTAGLLSATPQPGVDHRDTLPDTADINVPNKGQQKRVVARDGVVPQHVRWEDMHPDDQADVLSRAGHFGVSMSTLTSDFGAQVDQAHFRARQAGAPEPAGMRFYSGYDSSNPEHEHAVDARRAVADAARDTGVHTQTMVDSVALGSPRMAFHDSKHGDFPNIVGAAEYARRGLRGDPDPTSSPVMRPGVKTAAGEDAKVAMLPARGRIIADAAPQLEDGRLSDEVRGANGKGVFGEPGQEKITAFGPAFKDPHGSKAFFVSDTHSAGGGMVPHIAHHSYGVEDDEGNPVLDATTGEQKTRDSFAAYMNIPGIHQLHDYAARQALGQRGLSSVHSGQAAQWGEERIAQGETTEEESYRGFGSKHPVSKQFTQMDGQGELELGEWR